MKSLHIRKSNANIIGEITLAGSKSISNRVLIIQALCKTPFAISKLANAQDTQTMQALLSNAQEVYDVGPAGTTFRFLTAYLALQEGTQILTGSERMKNRPIGILADALNELGAEIEYMGREGYPPLKIHPPKNIGQTNQLSIAAGVSSQYISALLMIAPTLPNGLNLTLEGKIVSRPYIQMTLNIMAYFGIDYQWDDQTISIRPQPYQARDFVVEADWSAASYYYTLAAFSDKLDLQLNGLFEESVQGDAVIAKMMTHFGIQSDFNAKGVRLTKKHHTIDDFKYNFLQCPDIAQTLAVICGGLGVKGHFLGLETLKIKETDRVNALYQELAKVGVDFIEQPDQSCIVSGKAAQPIEKLSFATYEDHRMAMAFAPLAVLLEEFEVEEPLVVGKSYPDFWKDLEKLGFVCKTH